MTRRRTRLVTVVVAVVALLCGCTAVPTASRPQIIATLELGGGGATENPIKPLPGEQPHDLVASFLEANSLEADNHASARTFLTRAARARWSDSTATIVDVTSVGLYSRRHPSITVTGRVLGTLDDNGVYTPSLAGSGSARTAFVYGIARVGGQFRVSSLSIKGVLLSEDQFLSAYRQHSLYFYDLADHYLVPDPRWTSLDDQAQLDEWLVTELADGPSDRLQNAVIDNSLATLTSTRRVNVTVGDPIKVEIPRTRQLGVAARNRLAAQVAATLDDIDHERAIEITDEGKPIPIARTGSTRFASSQFTDALGPTTPVGDVYFLRRGIAINDSGSPKVGSAVNNGDYYLRSLAASNSGPTGTTSFAATAGPSADQRLLIGTGASGLRPTSLHGALSRPAYAPGRDEVWIGVGRRLDAVDVAGRTAKVTPVALPSTTTADGPIIAVRLSPEGSRIAIVAGTAKGGQALYVGAIVRNAGQIRIDTLNAISPEDALITDVGWVESAKLYATGYESGSHAPHVYETRVDGAGWNAHGIGEMPSGPTSFTVTPGQRGWAESEGALWIQSGTSDWTSAGATGQTDGTAPIYLE